MRPTFPATSSFLLLILTGRRPVNSFSLHAGGATRTKGVIPGHAVGRVRAPAQYGSISSRTVLRHGPSSPLKPSPSTTRRTNPLSRLIPAVSILWTASRRLVRRSLLTGALAVMLWGGLAVKTTAPSHASSSNSIEYVLQRTSPSLDRIVDRYVKTYMFADDAYDPVESIYREAYEDATVGQHPAALAEIKRQVLGDAKKIVAPTSEGFASWLTSTIKKLQQRGMSESAAILVLASAFVIAGPSLFLFLGMIIGGISKRNIRSVMKKRYGDTYTVDATIKKEEVVEAPDDEEDDDDEDSSDEDEDDDDE